MKMISNAMNRFVMLFCSILISIAGFAQEKGGADINVDINKGGGSNWYASPIVWIIGAAVFILLLVALLRGNRSSE
jgi:hypothetical protein